MVNNFTADERRLLTNATTMAGSVAVGVTAVRVMSLNSDRLIAALTNNSINDIFIGFNNSVTANTGIRLNAYGGAFEFGLATTFPWLGEVWAVAAVAGNSLTFVEV